MRGGWLGGWVGGWSGGGSVDVRINGVLQNVPKEDKIIK
jgi:hypothetical protein